MVCGSGGLKSRLAKAAGAEPAGQMRDEKLHAVVARSKFLSQHVQNTPTSDHFWKLWYRKSARRCCAKQVSKSKRTKHLSFGALLGVARDSAPGQKWAIREGFVAVSKTMAGVGRGSAKMSFAWQAQYKRHVHQSCSEARALISWEGLHFGASDLQLCSDDFAWQVQHFVWPCITLLFSDRRSTLGRWSGKNRKTHW